MNRAAGPHCWPPGRAPREAIGLADAPCAIGIDLGTSGVRGVRLDAAGRPWRRARRPLCASRDPLTGAHEHDPAALERAVREIVAALVDRSDEATPAIPLAIAGTSGSLLLADCRAPFDALTRCWLYDDRRSRPFTERLAETLPGGHPAAGSGASAARWLALAHAHGLAPGRACPVHPADWIALRLLDTPPGQPFSDHHNALKLGFDPGTLDWTEGLIPALAAGFSTPLANPVSSRRLIAALPRPVYAPGHPIGSGLAGRVRVHAGSTDANAAFVASLSAVDLEARSIRPDDAPPRASDGHGEAAAASATVGVTSLGSTLVIKQLAPRRIEDAASGVYSHRLGNGWIVSGASNAGAAALRRHFSDAALKRLSEQIDLARTPTPGVRALCGRGERFPWPDPDAEPVDPPPTLPPVARLHDLLAALTEVEHAGYARFAALGAPPITRVVTNGGGAVNAVWRRLRSARLGVPVDALPKSAIGWEAAIGAALLAQTGGHPVGAGDISAAHAGRGA